MVFGDKLLILLEVNGLKIRVSVVQFHLWPPANNYLYQYFNLNKSCFISRTNQVLQGSTSYILGYKPSTKFYISSTKCLHPHHPYGVPPYLVFLRETQSPEKIFRQQSDCFSINRLDLSGTGNPTGCANE